MFEELLISVLFIIVLIILCIISNLYSKNEEEKEKNKRRQEYEELHTLSGRINYHRSQEISTYKISPQGPIWVSGGGFFTIVD